MYAAQLPSSRALQTMFRDDALTRRFSRKIILPACPAVFAPLCGSQVPLDL